MHRNTICDKSVLSENLKIKDIVTKYKYLGHEIQIVRDRAPKKNNPSLGDK